MGGKINIRSPRYQKKKSIKILSKGTQIIMVEIIPNILKITISKMSKLPHIR